MAINYKRKFRVPGDTIRDCWYFRKKCNKQYQYRSPCRDTHSYHRDESKCPFPINKPDMYIVSEMEDGTWRCSCPVWKFKRRQCHHIDKAQKDPEKYEIAKEFTGRTVEVIDKIFQ